jgi:S1-C subfamily serine protease
MKTDKIAISAAFLFFVVGVCFGKIQPSGEIMSLQNNIREIAKTVNPAVVFIETSKAVTASDKKNNQQYGFPGYRWFFRDEDNEDDQEWQMDRGRKKDNNENDNNRIRPRMPQYQMPRGIGSGMIFKKEGYILTNYHVVEDSSEIKVTLFENNKKYTAELAGYDKRHDVAVIKIKESRDFPFVSLGNSDNTRIGDFVIALGNPFGYSNTVTMGIVSFKGRMFENVEITGIPKRIPNIIQTDAAINPGNSGGPLVDVSGEVIGVNVAIAGNFGFGAAGNQGIGFAIPINDVKRILDGLVLGKKNDSETPWIGVRL